MPHYKLQILYDGSNYCGWQIQKNQPSIQQTLKDAIEVLIREIISLNGSGRTDSGVHALGQVANFSCEQKLDLFRFRYSLNNTIPDDIAVTKIEEVDAIFHSRYDAKCRTYLYFISRNKTPFFKSYTHFYYSPLDIQYLNQLSRMLIGERDYTSFTKHEAETENKVCNILNAQWRSSKDFSIFRIEANRFLHGMVRTIVGTLLDFHKEKKPFEELTAIFEAKDRKTAGEAVPAKGLFLYKVKY
ncbi:MAG: tRNA pseudouridine(38-40) synthase TruA [Ignavibacteriaceae bacterium]